MSNPGHTSAFLHLFPANPGIFSRSIHSTPSTAGCWPLAATDSSGEEEPTLRCHTQIVARRLSPRDEAEPHSGLCSDRPRSFVWEKASPKQGCFQEDGSLPLGIQVWEWRYKLLLVSKVRSGTGLAFPPKVKCRITIGVSNSPPRCRPPPCWKQALQQMPAHRFVHSSVLYNSRRVETALTSIMEGDRYTNRAVYPLNRLGFSHKEEWVADTCHSGHLGRPRGAWVHVHEMSTAAQSTEMRSTLLASEGRGG